MSDLPATDPIPHSAGRVEQHLENWKRKLLDLSRRNRLLNFRPTKVSTVAVVDELPVEVFRQLYLERKPMRFKPVPERQAAPPENGAPDLWQDVGDEPIVEELVPVPDAEPADGRPARRHTDEWLQTTLAAERLSHSLRRIADQAQLTLEEQGVNTLFLSLGMLHFYEADQATELRRAPLLLLPVQLERSSARSSYTLRARDDEPLVNPALAEYLRREFAVQLPELPDVDALEDYDAADWFERLRAAIARQPRWSVATEIYLGLLSFQKFVMYKDLERNRGAFAAHRLVRQLATRSGRHVGLPADVLALDLDREHPPETTAQVVDADSSQLRAIAAVDRGYDLVLEGPPGTGKSQTITNLIARALSEGRSVLFVAEKMAALQVVYSRLKAAGLGDFCLEMHAQKANKRSVLQELGRSLDASLSSLPTDASVAPRLQAVRQELSEYARAVHTPEPPLGLSPFQGYGRRAALRDAPVVRLRRRADDLALDEVEDAARALRNLATAAAAVGDPTTHPWRDTTRTYYSAEARAEIQELLERLAPKLRETLQLAARVEEEFGLPPIRTLPDVARAADVADLLRRSPGVSLEVLTGDAWNTAPPLALQLIETGERAASLDAEARARLQPAALERDHAADAEVVERLHEKWWRMLSAEYRRVRREWLALRLPDYRATLAEQAAHLRAIDELRRHQAMLRDNEAAARELFGAFWQGEASDWNELADYVLWVVEFRAAWLAHNLHEQAAQVATHPRPDVAPVEELQALVREVAELSRELEEAVGWPEGYLSGSGLCPIPPVRDPPSPRPSPPASGGRGWRAAPGEGGVAGRQGIGGALARLEDLDHGFASYGPWTVYAAAAAEVAAGPAAELVPLALGGEVAFDALAAAFERAFFQTWLDHVVSGRPALLRFHGLTHEQRVAEFQELDRRVLQENRAALINRLRERVQQRLLAPEVSRDMTFLRAQLARSRGHAPLRRTLHEAHRAIKAIKPCFMMSPLTVAQFLDPQDHHFDLVVFDEASQMPAEDAIGAVVRGHQLVVVGDPKQLPPTNFFAVQSGQVEAPLGADGQPLFDDMESVLEEFMAAGIPKSRLRWHYRSQHESLIAFSNLNFYDAELFTFPSADTDTRQRGLQFIHVEDGVYEGAGLNRAEARRVADAVVEHIRTVPHLSLGVGTFNLRQQIAIQDELELRRRQDPSLDFFFAPRDEGAFFVKNLENIQGDDRDVILLSVTYAKGPDGRLRHNFGPINGENGWRRLNVLTTRARLRMRVYSSMLGDEINLAQTSAAGARYLREFLLFAERGQLPAIEAAVAASPPSPFEQEILQTLVGRGIRVVPQVGVAGYRVDLGVLDERVDGRFVCGIECDGAAYHSAETARDRDRLRQQVLEGLGWTIHRVWSTDWFKDPDSQRERLITRITNTPNTPSPGPSPQGGGENSEAEPGAESRSASTQTSPTGKPVSAADESVSERVAGVAEAAGPAAAGEGDGSSIGSGGDAGSSAVSGEGAGSSAVSGGGAGSSAVSSEGAGSGAVSGGGAGSGAVLRGAPYRMAQLRPRATAGGVLGARDAELLQAVSEVAETEAPVHIDDLASRIATAWGEARLGSRIAARIRQAVQLAERRGVIRLRGPFVWGAEDGVTVRDRAGLRIPAERIAPEEYREAVLQVLRDRGARARRELTADVRSLLGFARTGANLEDAIGQAIDGLLRAGVVGEGSAGLRLRG